MQVNGVDNATLNGQTFTEVDAVNQPGMYRINLTDALMTTTASISPGDTVQLWIDDQSAPSTPSPFKFQAIEQGADNSSIAATLATVDGKIDTIDTNVDSILVDTVSIEAKVDIIDTVVDSNATEIGLAQGAGFVTGTDSLEQISSRQFFGGTTV
jgi:hypothetical protein